VSVDGSALGSARLRRLAAPPSLASVGDAPRCDLCATALDAGHRHLLHRGSGRAEADLVCACRACAILFERHEAGGRRYRLVPEGCRRLVDFRLDEPGWLALGVPVRVAFFVRRDDERRIVACCPSAIGTTEAAVDAAAWDRLEADNPAVRDLEPDVEALLVHRAHGAREHWRAPVDVCYRLAAVVRTRWRGLGAGREVWTAIDRFFETLRTRGDR
jgi:hypothetical protein